MNGYIGMYNSADGVANWGSGYSAWRSYEKESQLGSPAPVNLWVFCDEQADSINDGFLIDNPSAIDSWGDLPASYHNQANGFSFADGHAEVHKWLEGYTCLPVRKTEYPGLSVPAGSPDLDWQWFMARTTALVSPGP
jgi:prepilin-type processing-associated H-X9-DG protein